MEWSGEYPDTRRDWHMMKRVLHQLYQPQDLVEKKLDAHEDSRFAKLFVVASVSSI